MPPISFFLFFFPFFDKSSVSDYDTLSVNVEFGGQNWPNMKWALQGLSGLSYVFLWHFYALKMVIFTKKS